MLRKKIDIELVKQPDVVSTSFHEGDIVIVNEIKELANNLLIESDMTILLMCKKGKIQICINGKYVKIEGSELVFILPNSTITNLKFSSDVDCAAICISSVRVQDFLKTQDLLNLVFTIRKFPLLHLNEDKFSNLMILKENVKQMFLISHPYYEKIMSHFVEIILYDIFGCYKDAYEEVVISAKTEVPNRTNQLFATFISLLHSYKGIHREVRFYANKMFITPKYLSAICKVVSGKTCSKWISEVVMVEIIHLLRYSDLSIKEVAYKLQFENLSSFSKYVRKYLGCTPIEYRKKYRINDN